MGYKYSRRARGLMVGAGLGLALSAAASSAFAQAADPRDAEIQRLEQEVQSLAAKVDALERKDGGAAAPAAAAAAPAGASGVTVAAAPPAPALPSGGGATIVAGKPQIASADGQFTANLHGVMQFDAANYDQTAAGPISTDFRRGAASTDTAHARDLSSGSDFRRARIGVDGKVFGDFDYNVLFEFGGAGEEDAGHVQELWLQYSGFKPFHFRIGAFPPSIGLEDQASTNGAPFLERPAVSDIARSVAGGDFREGAEIWGSGDQWYASAATTGRVVGVVNSQATGVAQPFDSPLGYIGRVAFLPIKTDDWIVHIGAHGSYVDKPADTGGPDTALGAVRYGITLQERPELRVDGTRLISTGSINAAHASTEGLEAAAQYGPFFVEGETERMDIQRLNPTVGQTNPHFSGSYVEGTWVLTGERRKYNMNTFAFDAPTIDHPFSPANNTWGAIELAARWSTVDLNYDPGLLGKAPLADSVRGGEQTLLTGGVNWYMNSAIRFMLDYSDVKIDRLSPSASTFSTPAGVQVGQHYSVISLRSQMAF